MLESNCKLVSKGSTLSLSPGRGPEQPHTTSQSCLGTAPLLGHGGKARGRGWPC